jgi:hypothetical protein
LSSMVQVCRRTIDPGCSWRQDRIINHSFACPFIEIRQSGFE